MAGGGHPERVKSRGLFAAVRWLVAAGARQAKEGPHLVAALRPLVVARVLLLQVARVGPGERVVLVANVRQGGVVPGVVRVPVPIEVREMGVGVGVADGAIPCKGAVLPAGRLFGRRSSLLP